jgi:putative hydrolase of the HAD superfamily
MPDPTAQPNRFKTPQTMLFDADDTLWENNIYFERAIASFISYLDHRVHSPEEVRAYLNSVERTTILQRGYGMKSFRHSLVTCFEQLTDSPITDEKHRRIESFAESIAAQEIELLPGVAKTIANLSKRHRLHVVTKGDVQEQNGKLDRSGLRQFFAQVEVVAEKDVSAYRQLVQQHDLPAGSTWMIGNSPKSDINPSMAAGLQTVFIPHGFTWILEHEAVEAPPAGQTLLELPSFADLLEYF